MTPRQTRGPWPSPFPAATGAAEGFSPERVIVERVLPQVNCGRFPIKRAVGDTVVVTAHVYADGHDVLRAVLWHRRVAPDMPEGVQPGTVRAAADPDAVWTESPLELLGNDEWRGRFEVEVVGRYEYGVTAWVDPFETWRHELEAKSAAGQDVSSELLEGARLVGAAADRAAAVAPASGAGVAHSPDLAFLRQRAEIVGGGGPQAAAIRAALDDRLRGLMARYDGRPAAVSSAAFGVTVERLRARFGAWYEMFPRSAGTDATRGATLREAEARLAAIADLGFDVLYLPPVHPIGRSFRKGANNSLTAGPEDPGSPWAIGSEAGGHMAVDPSLGTIEDFDHFVAAAARLGLEVAIDIAFQCSPDHPYVRTHPEWFRHRPDGTIKYAENPPKKYQDIYPFDFESSAAPALWAELKQVILFWIDHGVRIFRVDNPHTKPYRFWEWLIREVRLVHPDIVFLSEAFTRPKVMYYLAKIGFSQSYTYFTWRNTRSELTDYFTELTATEVAEFFRPNLFTNTPDILHAYLQEGGRPAFEVRLVLAATLGANYGIYSGFELCENQAVSGTEEYLNSEKYEIRVRDWNQPGNIKDLIRRVNRIRRDHAALQSDAGLQFFETDNPQLLCYAKLAAAGRDAVIVVVNLDPHWMQHGQVRLPLDVLGLPDDATYEVVDLLDGVRYTWRGPSNYVRLDPIERCAHIFRLS